LNHLHKNSKRIIVIAGPTAVGKTALAVNLAKYFKTSVISADSRQFYKEMNIGTAKPSSEEMGGVPHYFIDSLSIKEDYNVGCFEKEALNILKDLFKHNNTVIVSGGSGLYVKALCEGINQMPEIPSENREKLIKSYQEKGLAFLQEQLMVVDPDYCKIVDLNNPQRLIRALELFETTGKNMTYFRSFSSFVQRPFDMIKIGLERPRDELYARIDERMDKMIDQGLFQEAESLLFFKQLNALHTVGYTEIFSYLNGDYDKEEAIRLLKRNSRRYAKRQLTWFKKDSDFTWFHPENESKIIMWLNKRLNSLIR
jgi:tRNA dimethylallyltransferase